MSLSAAYKWDDRESAIVDENPGTIKMFYGYTTPFLAYVYQVHAKRERFGNLTN